MDEMTAQARRFYHHVHNGGVLKEHDVAGMVEYMECKDAEISRLTAERDQATRREQALKSSYDEERKALVENIRLRVRIKELEAERDQALASVGAVIEQAAAMVATPDEDDDALDKQTRLIASEQLRCDFNPDATAALNEMLAEAWEEGYDIGVTDGGNEHGYCVDHNPYRKGAT